jgi:hypothetical protein
VIDESPSDLSYNSPGWGISVDDSTTQCIQRHRGDLPLLKSGHVAP